MVEQLIRNQQVVGSSPIFSSNPLSALLEGFFIYPNIKIYILIIRYMSKFVKYYLIISQFVFYYMVKFVCKLY